MVGINETAESAIATFYDIVKLRQKIEEKQIIQLGKKVPLAKRLISYLYSKPIVDITEIASVLEVNISTAHRLVQDFERLKILKEQTGFKRNKIYVFEQYLSLFR